MRYKEKSSKVAIKSNWKTQEMPKQNDTFILERVFSVEQMKNLSKGYIPSSMDEKWFLYMENNTLFIHRSWTGFCIYKIEISPDNRHKVIVNRNPMQHTCTNIDKDKDILNRILDYYSGKIRF